MQREIGSRRRRDPRASRTRGARSDVLATVALGVSLLLVAPSDLAAAKSTKSLLLATTTSLRDSGLLDTLLPIFETESGIEVQVVAVGTGAALRMGREGNADLLLTHAPASEQRLVEEGVISRRTPFMENHFVIAGPPEDPAGVADSPTAEEALRRIAATRAGWVSRADDSGTHKREVHLFASAGLAGDASWPGLVRTGSGMGLSLQVAGEKRAYILSDIGTYLAFRDRIDLAILSTPSASLRNVYSILQLDGSRFEHALHSEEAHALEAFLLSRETLARIARFGRTRFGRPLFTPIRPAGATPPSESMPPTPPKQRDGRDASR